MNDRMNESMDTYEFVRQVCLLENMGMSELESARIGKCKNYWKVSELFGV